MESKYSQWSAENATKAYLKTLKMGIKRPNREPDTLEFISAIAAGNNAKLILVACGETTTLSTLLALQAAASQTKGRVICIYRDLNQLQSTKQALSQDANDSIEIEVVLGDTKRLIREKYQNVDFVLNDCELENHQELLREMQCIDNGKGAIVLRSNAFTTKSWECAGLRTQLLPIGDGLLVTRITNPIERKDSIGNKGHWVVKVDEYTGEEHVFRVRCPNIK